jgi:hypothetical protein
MVYQYKVEKKDGQVLGAGAVRVSSGSLEVKALRIVDEWAESELEAHPSLDEVWEEVTVTFCYDMGEAKGVAEVWVVQAVATRSISAHSRALSWRKVDSPALAPQRPHEENDSG